GIKNVAYTYILINLRLDYQQNQDHFELVLCLDSNHVIANLAELALVKEAPAVRFDRRVVAPQLVEQPEIETRYSRRIQVGPCYSVLGIEPDLDLLVVPPEHSLYRFEIDRCVHDLFPFF